MIDLSSDTATRPTPEMRRFMAEAPVGDEQRREDPTVNELQAMAATLLGKEAALFLPSGTMCNMIGYSLLAERGDAVILDRFAHPNLHERGGPAWISGVMLRPLVTDRGIFSVDQVAEVFHPGDTHGTRSSVISVENTSNAGGGRVWPLERLAELRAFADEHGMAIHMDGARLMNAAVASGNPAATFASYADTVWLDLSKGLGAPVGAVIAGSAEMMEKARRLKHMLGGAMRQAGIIAAAGIYALRHHVDRLAEDHANAQVLAKGLSTIPGIRVPHDPIETNIVFFDVGETGLTTGELGRRIEANGVRMGAEGPTGRIRAVTHLDVSREDCETAVEVVRAACR